LEARLGASPATRSLPNSIHVDGFSDNRQAFLWAVNHTTATMNRIDAKRRNVLDHRKKQFADPTYKETQYPHRLNFYASPPTADITLEQFEQWAIDRLRSTWAR
jgi:hypothetical protein